MSRGIEKNNLKYSFLRYVLLFLFNEKVKISKINETKYN